MAFTRDWNESAPDGKDNASAGDDSIRNLKVEMSDRLKDMLYGLIAGENSLAQHFQYMQFYEQASVAQPSAAYGRLYCKAVGGKCELFWIDEDGDDKQITSGGVLLIAAGDYVANSIDEDDIQLANNAALTALDAAGTGTVNLILAGTNDLPTLPDSAEMASNAAPTEDEGIANKKYVDDQDAADHPTYTGGQSHTDGSGLIMKMGADVSVAAGSTATVTFAAAFTNGIVTAVACMSTNLTPAQDIEGISVISKSTTKIVIENGDNIAHTFNWIAIGY